ncbi:MAG: hypothetical protein CBC29_00550 [Methylococcaceae bacterium TMED69]|nr:MAG: hypothetical protein CBC29_00550 [Methylococcaceae bacterium TMED69]|tara:strand:- start:54 stop:509 length:456 start_codon:yes stop_codon:yes gene_type:complete
MNTQFNNRKTSQIPWLAIDSEEKIKAKVLSLNRSDKTVELLFKIKAGYRSGPHRHTCETRIYVISGKIINHSIKETFEQGDYCFQASNDTHDEEFTKNSLIYVNYKSKNDRFVEFLDEHSNVLDTLTMQHFEEMILAQSKDGSPKPPPPGV